MKGVIILMRSCIYCGRDLKDGEICDCPTAQAKRNAKKASSHNTEDNRKDAKNHKQYNTSYQTGYVRKDGPFKRIKDKLYARANASKSCGAPRGHFWGDLWRFIKRFIFAPIETIQNPGHISLGMSVVIAMLSCDCKSVSVFYTNRCSTLSVRNSTFADNNQSD